MIRLLFILTGIFMFSTSLFADEKLYIIKDGKASAIIVIPEKADKWTTKAAEWFRDYIEKSSGAKLEITEENNLTNAANIISVGHTKLAMKEKIKPDDLKWDGCKLIVKGNTLFLLGRDDGEFKNDWGGDAIGAKGTGRAVVTFLEDFAGIRWFFPIPEGVLIPKKNDIWAPADLNKTVMPAFAFAHGRYPYGHGTPASIANNYRTGAKILTYGGHSFYLWLPVNKYFEEHPEYFALINGKRVKQGNHLCTSNPEVKKILLENLRAEFNKGWDWVALGPEDGYLRCQCHDCEKLDNFKDFEPYGFGPRENETWDDFFERNAETPCERLFILYKWLADQCLKSHPDKKIHMLIYGPTVWPSKKIAKFGDNVVGEIALYNDRLTPKLLDMWKGKIEVFTLMRGTWFNITTDGMGVMMTPQEISKKIRTFYKKDVIGIYAIYGANWGLSGPCYYVLGKMMGNPDLDYNTLMEEYCSGLYGKAGKPMKDFFDVLYSRSPGMYITETGAFNAAERHLIVYPPAFLKRLEAILKNAETAAKDENEKVKKFIELTRLHYDYLKLITNMQIAYLAYQAGETAENLKAMRERTDEFEKYRAKVISLDGKYTQLWPMHDMFCKFLIGGGIDSNYYANWNQLKKKIDINNLRGTVVGFSGSAIRKPVTMDFTKQETKRSEMTVKRVPKAPKLDGLLESAEWDSADVQMIEPLTKETKLLVTKVRIIYDHENLYVAFECEEPEITKMKIQSKGKDGNVWALDHVELFLDPEKSMKRRFHLMAAPINDATYDAKIGFEAMNDADISWNGDWKYGFQIDEKNKKWTMELAIPFKSLNMETPQDGDSIAGNFARARYAGGTHDPELNLWSHGETGGFSDPSAFGTLVFKHVLY